MNEPITITIYGRPIVKKSNQRVVWTGGYPKKINTKAYNRWHKSAVPQVNLQKPDHTIDYPVNAKCEFYMPTKGRVDLSALYESWQDVFVECGILEDDNYKIVASHDGSGVFLDRETPRTVITLTRKVVENESNP